MSAFTRADAALPSLDACAIACRLTRPTFAPAGNGAGGCGAGAGAACAGGLAGGWAAGGVVWANPGAALSMTTSVAAMTKPLITINRFDKPVRDCTTARRAEASGEGGPGYECATVTEYWAGSLMAPLSVTETQ